MRTIGKVLVGLGAAIAVCMLAAVLVAMPDNAQGALDVTSLLPAFALGQKLQMPTSLTSYTFEALRQRARPASQPGVAEANIDVLYDTQTYPAAGSAQLNFFNAPSADPTLSNMGGVAKLDDNVYFDVWRIFVDANRVPTATVADTAAGAINDIATILHTARAVATFRMYDKPLGPIPLTFFGNSGSVEGIIGSGRAAAAGAVIQVARTPDNGGWPVNGTIKIPPLTAFRVVLDFISTAVAVDTPLRVSLLGVKYRLTA